MYVCFRFRNSRSAQFEKPTPSGAGAEHFMSTNQQVRRLENDLEAKEKENTLLREQLFKAHEDNLQLVQAINMCVR